MAKRIEELTTNLSNPLRGNSTSYKLLNSSVCITPASYVSTETLAASSHLETQSNHAFHPAVWKDGLLVWVMETSEGEEAAQLQEAGPRV